MKDKTDFRDVETLARRQRLDLNQAPKWLLWLLRKLDRLTAEPATVHSLRSK